MKEILEPEIALDIEAQAVYIKFTDNEIHHTEAVTDLTLIDYDNGNEIVGVELIDAIESFIPVI